MNLDHLTDEEKKARRKQQLRAVYQKNKEKILERCHARYAAKRDEILARGRAWHAANKDRANARNLANYHKDRENRMAQRRTYIEENREDIRRKSREYAKRKPEVLNANTRLRVARKLRATPLWANEFFIKEAYALAQLRGRLTGGVWHVDHVVPLKSHLVCGLHCEQNFQVIPSGVNQSKNNRHWPDMPC